MSEKKVSPEKEREKLNEDIINIIRNLKLLSKLESNEKISPTSENIQRNDLVTSIRRSIWNFYCTYISNSQIDSRFTTLEWIEKIFKETERILNECSKYKEPFYDKIRVEIRDTCRDSLNKISQLSSTYKDDKHFAASLEAHVVFMKSHLEQIK